jgi:DNA polymerase I-like protein with 3'-5' exonuclease and polymerase domains
MEIAPGTETKPLTVGGSRTEGGGVIVNCPSNLYAAGHVCNENEAGVLNQTVRENMRNNFDRKAKELLKAGRSQAEIQAEFDQVVASYAFGVRRGGGGFKPRDPVEKEKLRLATIMVESVYRKKGLSLKDHREAIQTKAAEFAQRPEIQKRAEQNVKAAQNLEKDLEESLGQIG